MYPHRNDERVDRVADDAEILYVAAETGPAFWGPGDRYTFLVTGEQSGGSYFILECFVPPGGGPPPHYHEREEECFYLLEGTVSLMIGGREVQAGPGDFVHIPRRTVHGFRNTGDTVVRMLAIFSPAGMEGWFKAAYEPAPDRVTPPPPPSPEMLARMAAAAPEHGVRFV